MISLRSWMLGLALGAVISSTNSTDATAQVPRNISYQGQLLENNQAATGAFTITLNYYTAGGSTPIYTETFSNVPVENGIFNVILGSNGGFPASMDFNEQYFVGVQVNGGQELTPRTAMLASPYALNANAVNGFTVSDLPAAGQLLVLDANGRVPQSALPASPRFVAGNNITIQQDSSSNTYIFSSTGGQSSGITGVTVGNGLIGGGTSGEIQINLAPNGITTDMIAPGAITGTRLSPTLAGEGLYQDILGNLNVGVDGSSIVIRSDDRLAIGTIGGSNIDSTIQRRITGVATPGTFITGVNPNGTITSGTIATDSSLTRTVNGSDVALGLNPAYSNTFTAPQNFDVINANTVNTQTLNADMVMTDDLMAHGNIMFGNGITNGNVTFNTGTGVISLSGATLQNVGTPINGTDAVNRNYVDSAFATQALGGDISGPNGANTLNLTNPGIGDRLVTGINSGTTTVNDPAINDSLTINGGTINNTPIGATGPSSGNFTTLNSSEQTMLATGSGDVVIGTASPVNTGAILEIERAQDADLLARLYNTGTGGAEFRIIGNSGVNSTLSFTDNDDYVSSINSNDATGLTFNVRDLTDPNSEAGLDAAVAMTIERDGDVVINEDLTVLGAVNFGNGDDNLTFNSGTGAVDFSGSRITNVADPVNAMDAVNLQTLNNAVAGSTLAGDISGPNGANTLDVTNPGIGDRLVTGVNSGTTTINDPAVADNLTIDGGTINNTPIGTTGASSGMFTTLSSTGQTDLATATDRVVIGTSAPTAPNNTILEIERPMAEDLMARIYNSGAGGAELRLAGADGVQSTLSFTDDSEWVSSINSNDAVGMTFNMRDVGDVNSEAAMDAATVMTIERDGDVVINEDLTVLGAVNFGNGDDNLTFNSGTGTVDFSGSRLTNVADPINNMDAVNLQSLNNAITAATPAALAGDITGPNGANTLDVTNPGIGDRLVTGVNSGTTTINDPAVADNLTIDGGTINNTPITGGTIDGTDIGTTTAGAGNFTTLNATSQTQVATTSGNLVVGTATPSDTDAIIQVQRSQAADLLQRIYNTGTGGAELRLAGASGATNTLGFTDDNEWVASVNANDAVGMTFNVRDLTDPNSEAGLDAAVAMTIERDRDVVINEDLTVGGEMIANSAATGLGISTRYADTYTVTDAATNSVTVPNTLVTPNSTVIVTVENNSGATIPKYTVQTDATGSFTVEFDSLDANTGDEIHYIIINH